jgi:hypothetical protein
MARRRAKGTANDDSAVAFPTEADTVGLQTMEREPARTESPAAGSPAIEGRAGEVSKEEIARLAYQRYQERGRAAGFDQEDWYAAEREIQRSRSRDE